MKHLFLFFVLLFTLSACSDKEDIYVDDLKVELKNDRIHKPLWLRDVVDELVTHYKEKGYDYPLIDIWGVSINDETYIMVTKAEGTGMIGTQDFYTTDGRLTTCTETPCEIDRENARLTKSIWMKTY